MKEHKQSILGGKTVSYTASHWGLYQVESPMSPNMTLSHYPNDHDPSPIGLYLNHRQVEKLRVTKPAIRRGWYEQYYGGKGAPRGGDDYIEVEWEVALNIVAAELTRVKTTYGNQAIYGGSYGWSSSGRFHHAQSQIHRFLNSFGGYVRHKDSYSLGAAGPLMHWLVMPMGELMTSHTDWATLAKHTEIFLSFGGAPRKNAQVSYGGTVDHRLHDSLCAMNKAGVRFINISPVQDDIDTEGLVTWLPIKPNTDTALILGLAYTLWQNQLHDMQFIQRYCVGFDVFEKYLTGQSDGIPKTAQWAANITGIKACDIEALAFDIADHRTMVNMAWALQRAHHGEQPCFALVTLAAMLGQIGLPGGGFGFCYGAENLVGSPNPLFFGPTLEQGQPPIDHFIPVARVVDMLLNPGKTFTYQGETHTYQDIRMIYWAGGNPFHHHQNLNQLAQAWQRPETIITHEQYWTPSAKMADIVLPVTTTLERNDIFYANRETVMAAMKQAKAPTGEAKDDYSIFSELAKRLNIAEQFTQGLDAQGWLAYLYTNWQVQMGREHQLDLPDFNAFWENDLLELPKGDKPLVLLENFRKDPDKYPLKTPSGKIEIFSQSIADFNLPDCPGFACWLPPHEWLGSKKAAQFPLHMISDQPKNKLHSQLDHSPHSQKDKINQREPIYINSEDAAIRGLQFGDLVRVFNQRGSCLASAVPSDKIRQGVVRLSTGAWFDPLTPRFQDGQFLLEKHGNPNALTADIPASSFSQGCSAQTCLVEVQRWQGESYAVTAYEQPNIVAKSSQNDG